MNTDIALKHNGGGAIVGYFSTSDRRNKVSLEARKTHFILGKHNQMNRNPYQLSRNFMLQGSTSDAIKRAVGDTIEDPRGKELGNANKTQGSSFKLGDPQVNTRYWVTNYNT